MFGLAVHITNPFDYQKDIKSHEIRDGITVRGQARIFSGGDEFTCPTICVFNGEPLLRDEWGMVISDGDLIVFITLAQGGGKDTGQTILKIALVVTTLVVAPLAGAGLAGALGFTSAVATTIATAFVASVFLGGGFLLINAILPPPKALTPDIQNSIAAPSPTYTLSGQGNYARVGQAIPVIYGRHKIYPDFAITPYSIYDDNVQTLYQMFVVGQGYNSIQTLDGVKQIFIDDTPVSNYGKYGSGNDKKKIVDYRLLQPGEPVPNDFDFETNIAQSVEVTGVQPPGEEDTTEDWTPWYVITPVDTVASHISVDISLPRGLYKIPSNGKIQEHTVTYQFQAQRIDNEGNDIGSEFDFATGSVTMMITGSYRFTVKNRVEVGRYKIRCRRTDTPPGGDVTYVRDLWWIGAKSHLFIDDSDYKNVTLLLIKMAAVGGLTTQSSTKVNLVVERKLKTWSSASGWSSDPVATRSIAWAFADACKSDYGGQLTDSQIDLAAIEELDTIWTNRGDTFNGVFDRRQSIWESLTAIARCGRAIPLIRAGVITMVRDQTRSLVSGMFSMRNIIPNTLKISYIIANDQVADALSLEYFDERSWQPNSLSVQIADEDGEVDPDPNLTAEVKMFGCTNRAQAWREGIYLLRSNRYRRKMITFETELEGYIPTYGSDIRISHDMPAWGISGDITSYSDLTYTTSVPLEFETGKDHYVAFRKRDGSLTDAVVATKSGDDDNVFALAANPPNFTPDTGFDRERTHFCFGPGQQWAVKARVVAIEPRTGLKVSIKCVEEDDELHAAEGDPPVMDELVFHTVRITNNEVDVNVFEKFENNNVDMSVPARFAVIVENNIKITSSRNDIAAMVFSGFPAESEIYLTNLGQIMGAGGGGGVGGGWFENGNHYEAGNGSDGGNAIETNSSIYIDNMDGEIFAGGGGGGGGAAITGLSWSGGTSPSFFFSGGGGGGGAGHVGGPNGDRGNQYPFFSEPNSGHGDEGQTPPSGQCSGGSGGVGYDRIAPAPEQYAGTGGDGGDCGEAGSPGSAGSMHFPVSQYTAGVAGEAGYAVLASGGATVTWLSGKTDEKVKGRE